MTKQEDLLRLIQATASRVIERPLPDIDLDTPISSLGIDSVSLAEIVTVIEDTLGIEVQVSEWLHVRTMKDFIGVIEGAEHAQKS